MKNFAKKLSAITLCTVFASMQVSMAAIDTGDIGIGNAHGGSYINTATGGYMGTEVSNGNANLNFNGNAHINWDRLNVGSGESMNFNAINGVKGITVVNTVNNGMTQVYGAISANDGIARLIISNPNGMLFDGANLTAAGDVQLTQALKGQVVDGKLQLMAIEQAPTNGIAIKDSNFSVGGQFKIVAPTIDIIKSAIKAKAGMKLVTADGQNYLICPDTSNDEYHTAVKMESVSVDGNVYIVSGKDLVNFVNGGTINGNLTIESDGNVALNSGININEDKKVSFDYDKNSPQLTINGNLVSNNDGRISFLRNAKVTGNVDMSNSGGFLEIADVKVDGNANLKTTVKTNEQVKHFIHVVGDTEVNGDLDIDSIHNIHIGGYDAKLQDMAPGSLKVGGNLNATAHEGSIAVTIDTTADKVDLTSGTLNIISDGKATITANEYKLQANRYIGGVDTKEAIMDAMENYKPLPTVGKETFLNIAGGNVTKIKTTNDNGIVYLRSNGSMDVNGVNSSYVALSAGKDIKIGSDTHAKVVKVFGETRNLTVNTPADSRDYTLKYTNIKDTEVIVIDPKTEITYDMANGENGWNKGTQTKENTYLVVPGKEPVNPPVDSTTPDVQDNEPEKVLNNMLPDQIAKAIDAQQVYTPVAFAADLDDEIDTGVRKNVDGSVTVVRPYTPSNK